MSSADLTFAEAATIVGILEPSEGTLNFQKGGSVSGTLNITWIQLALQTANLSFLGTGKLLTNAGTTITGANFLNLSQGATLEAAGSLKMDGFSTGSKYHPKINADTTITSNSPSQSVQYVCRKYFNLWVRQQQT